MLIPTLSSHLHRMAKRVRPECTYENRGRRHRETWLRFVHSLLRAVQKEKKGNIPLGFHVAYY
uniref:Predicted protein n=1 Tax=Hordeum vulgare subsp. vulgare TaxID=112509 RepID=F2EKB3_HORVV|nr:predicted protein [Hordeum vulgare subsp. vulgare]